jgi:hypothetical protein
MELMINPKDITKDENRWFVLKTKTETNDIVKSEPNETICKITGQKVKRKIFIIDIACLKYDDNDDSANKYMLQVLKLIGKIPTIIENQKKGAKEEFKEDTKGNIEKEFEIRFGKDLEKELQKEIKQEIENNPKKELEEEIKKECKKYIKSNSLMIDPKFDEFAKNGSESSKNNIDSNDDIALSKNNIDSNNDITSQNNNADNNSKHRSIQFYMSCPICDNDEFTAMKIMCEFFNKEYAMKIVKDSLYADTRKTADNISFEENEKAAFNKFYDAMASAYKTKEEKETKKLEKTAKVVAADSEEGPVL